MSTPVAGQTHHIVLTDGTDTLGLLSADEMRTFLRQPLTRTSLKTAQGDTLYSDLEPPYNTTMQNDFSGGRGNRYFRDDKSMFYDSNGVDTRFKGQCILGPAINQTMLANVGMPEHAPGSVVATSITNSYYAKTLGTYHTGELYEGMYLAESFPVNYGKVIKSVTLKFNNKSDYAINVTVEIRATTSDHIPTGSALTNGSVTASVATGTNEVTFTFTNGVSVTTGNWYALSVHHHTAAVAGYGLEVYRYGYDATAALYTESADGTTWVTGLPNDDDSWGYYTEDLWFKVTYSQVAYAQSFVYSGSGSYSVDHLYLYLRRFGTVTPTIYIETDSSSKPSNTTAHANATATLSSTDIPNDGFGWVRVDFASFSLTKGTTYWIVLLDNTQRAEGSIVYWGADPGAGYSGGAACIGVGEGSTGAATWSAHTGYDFYFRINSGQGLNNSPLKMIEYQSQLYVVDTPIEGSTSGKLWMNGDRGAADSNSGALTTLVDASKSWTTNEWAGCLAKIIAGPGAGEVRTIASNTSTALTVSDAWTTTHTTSSNYVILGSSKWTDVTPAVNGSNRTHTITAPVTDIAKANAILYLAQGESYNILRIREYNNAGTWTQDSAEDGTNKAVLLLTHKDRLYRSASINQVSYAPWIAWGTNLTFGTAINIGWSDSKITALTVYDGDVWVGKEVGIWQIKNDIAEQIPVDFRTLASEDNCRNMCRFNVYLFFPLGYGLERLYGMQVDDIGPNRGDGMPAGRQGIIVDMLPTPGMLYAAMDAGSTGTGSILAYNELGWHEIIRGTYGERMRCMYLQVIPGGPNRLWFGMGNDVVHCLMPSKTVNPFKDSSYRYTSTGSLITGWIDLHMAAVTKYFKDFKIVAEKLVPATQAIDVYYQLDGADDSDTWTYIAQYDTSPFEEFGIGERITGKSIRFKITLLSIDSTKTPNLVAWVMDSLARIEPKSRFEFMINLRDNASLLNGATDTQTRANIIAQLEEWAAAATPLVMTTCDPAWTNMTVLVEPLIETQKVYQVTSNGGGEIVSELGRLVVLEA